MKKYWIRVIIVCMSLSLIGGVALQWFWLQKAYKMKQDQVDHSVMEALHRTVDKLDKIGNVQFVGNECDEQSLCDAVQCIPNPKKYTKKYVLKDVSIAAYLQNK